MGPLAHRPSRIIQRLIIAKGLGFTPTAAPTPAWSVYSPDTPDKPDNVIVVRDSPDGVQNGRGMFGGEVFEYHGVQVTIRAFGADAGYAKARALAILFDTHAADATGIYNATIAVGSNTYLVQTVSRTGDVLHLGVEAPQSQRDLFAINALVTLRMLT